jgi:hypothetical protein
MTCQARELFRALFFAPAISDQFHHPFVILAK